MINIDELDANAWLAFHRDRVDTFYSKGHEFKPVAGCSTCDPANDYICFEHELEQLRAAEGDEQ